MWRRWSECMIAANDHCLPNEPRLSRPATQPHPQLGQAHSHRLAALAFPGRFSCRQSVAVSLPSLGGKAALGKIVRRSSPPEIQFGRVLFGFAQDEVARREKGVEFGQIINWPMSAASLRAQRPGCLVRLMTRESGLHISRGSRSYACSGKDLNGLSRIIGRRSQKRNGQIPLAKQGMISHISRENQNPLEHRRL